LVPPGPNAGPTQRIQGTIGSGDVSIPLDIVSLNISSFADLTSIPNREGSYELTFSCSAEIMNISPKHCGDIIGEDSASSISNNFAVCTVRSDFFSENDIIQMGESFCGSFTGKSTADTALASRPRSGEEFPLNAAASAGRLKMTEIKLPLPNNSLLNIDFIETVSTSVWVLIRVETKSGKWKIKYWKVYF
jgi:hypothetical protein